MSDYVLETRTVTLPLNGKEAVLKETDGYKDKLLIRKNKRLYELVADYLALLVVSIGSLKKVTAEHILDLYIPDQNFLLIEGYRLAYGDVFDFNNMCFMCGEESQHEVALDSMKFRYPDVQDTKDYTISVTLPKTKKTVVLGLITGHKEAVILGGSDSSVDPIQSEYQSIRSIDGSTDFSYEDVIKLPSADHKALYKARKKLDCGYDSVIRVVCPKCDSPALVNVLTHRDFLFPTG